MKYFSTVKTLDEAKALYKKLAMENHPDKGGETAIMQEINSDFEVIFSILKFTSKIENKENATEYKRSFYSENGWEGSRYDSSLRVKEIGKIMRDYVKYVYPTFKFSILSTYNSVSIYMMEAPVNMFIESADIVCFPNDYGITKEENEKTIKRGNVSVNQYYIQDETLITDYAKQIFTDIHAMLVSYNRDDSDSMTDYFDTNFYEHLEIGRWNKPFQVVVRTARLSGKAKDGLKKLA